MKVNNETREVGRHGTSNEREFSIKGSAKAFKILSDGLYSDKILAVIRELSCNAKDSHVDAGKGDVPFEIHLPNTLEPWFAVTDNGIGLCNEDVENMYSTYFESTKTDSNEVTGCLGLGSKSPFAYVDSFTVESRWNGKLTLFSCFYNEAGIPSITMMGEPMNTTEHNGLTVKMAVREQDMREFASKAANVLRRFIPAPTVTGNTSYAIKTVEYLVEGTDWKLVKGENHYSESKVNAIQGNVTYPISRNSLGDLTETQRAIMDLSVDMFFNIGELDVAANREALGYDNTTIANIKAKLDVVATEIAPLFQDKFKDCKTLWEARVLFQEVIKPLPRGLQNILSNNDVGLKWHKQPLGEAFKFNREEINVTIVQFLRGVRGNRGQFVEYGYHGDMKFEASANVLFFYDDIGHGSHSRVTHFIETNESAVKQQFLIKTDNRKLLKKFSKTLGNVTLQPVSNLPKRPKTVRATMRVTSKVLEYVGRHHDRRDSWNPTELDFKTGGVYVMINRFKVFDITKNPSGTDSEREVNDFDSIVELAKENGVIDLTGKTIYGIRKGDVAKLKDDSGWISLFDLVRDKLAVAVKTENVAQIMADREAFNSFSCDLTDFIKQLDRAKFANGTPMAIFLHAYDYMRGRDSTRAKAITNVAEKVKFTITDATPKHDLEVLWEAVRTQYPLIKILNDHAIRGGYYNRDTVRVENYAHLKQYLELIDAQNKTIPAEKKEKAA